MRTILAVFGLCAVSVAADTDWPLHGRTWGEERFSPLKQVHDGSVQRLGLAWSFEIDTTRGLEATPLVINGTMYFTSAWSVYALDARTGRLKWQWDPKVPRSAAALACCDAVNRGVAFHEGKVYFGTLDGRLVALDSASGKPVWVVQTTDREKPYTITGAPRIARDKVLIGNGGAENGVRGYVTAYDARSGKQAWRFYTVPGDPRKPFESPALERAAKTWTGEWWKYGGGGTVWDSMCYDPDLDLVYVGTGNGSPWNRQIRSPGGGDNLYLASILALRRATGELVWHYQTTPGDSWDYTAVQHMVLTDLVIEGRRRKVVMQAPKNGFFYVLDRRSGDLISADLPLPVSWALGVDVKTGRPVEAPGARYINAPFVVNPGFIGRHNFNPMSWSPLTGLVYMPLNQTHDRYEQPTRFEWQEGVQNLGVKFSAPPSPAPHPPGLLMAWDPVARRERWRVEYQRHANGGTLATAGNLVFQGTSDGRFVAYRADTGKALWTSQTGIGVIASPISYELSGRQFISILVGWGGASGLLWNATGNLGTTGRLLTYCLDGQSPMPPVKTRDYPALTALPVGATSESVGRGTQIYFQYCFRCHGGDLASGGPITDLRRSDPSLFEHYEQILLQGALQSAGMPRFGHILSSENIADLRAFVLSRRAALLVHENKR